MFSDKIDILPISEINSRIVPNLENYKNPTVKYFYDKTPRIYIKIFKCTDYGNQVIIENFPNKFNIKVHDFLLYNYKLSFSISYNSKCCDVCDRICCDQWYEKEMKEMKEIFINNPLNLPVMNDYKFLPRCMCERCYDLFPYIKFYELSDKILLLKELLFNNIISYDVKQCIFYFLIMA